MERATLNSSLDTGLIPTWNPEWWWLWRRVLLCYDFHSARWPHDIGGYQHLTGFFQVLPTVGAWPPTRDNNEVGPAHYISNPNNTAPGRGWILQNSYIGGGTDDIFRAWTLAVCFDRRGFVANSNFITTIYKSGQGSYFLRFTTAGVVRWEEQPQGGGSRAISDMVNPPFGTITDTMSVVVTVRHNRETVLYVNGKEVASAAWGDRLFWVNLWYMGTTFQAKANTSLNGTIGPWILSRDAWTAAQVAQWSADPYGYMAPVWEPQNQIAGQLESDVRTRRGVECDQRTRATVEGDQRSRATVEGDQRSKATVEADIRTRPTVEGDVKTGGR